MANQYLTQMDDQTAAAVFGNVGTMLMFQVGAQDAEVPVQQLGGGITPEDLMTLPRYQAYARVLIAGQPSRPFSMRTLSPAGTSSTRNVRRSSGGIRGSATVGGQVLSPIRFRPPSLPPDHTHLVGTRCPCHLIHGHFSPSDVCSSRCV